MLTSALSLPPQHWPRSPLPGLQPQGSGNQAAGLPAGASPNTAQPGKGQGTRAADHLHNQGRLQAGFRAQARDLKGHQGPRSEAAPGSLGQGTRRPGLRPRNKKHHSAVA